MIKEKEELTLAEMFEAENPKFLRESAQPFFELMMQYRCALMEVETKLNVLNEEFKMRHNRNPFEYIKSRIKEPLSILEKMQRRELPITVENVEENLSDIAGIRVICSFPDDIYTVAGLLLQQDDIRLLEKKDYIANPKPNGYRSLHLIVEVPVFLANQKKWMKAEVQFRTIAMDFWASVEHKLKYKQDIDHAELISEDLRSCAEVINDMDYRMQSIRDKIGAE